MNELKLQTTYNINMKVFHLLFLFTIVASQVALAKSDDALNKDQPLLKKSDGTDTDREL